MTEEERKHYRMLVGLSTNLNQIAHKANSQIDFISLAFELQNTRREIDAILSKINNNDL